MKKHLLFITAIIYIISVYSFTGSAAGNDIFLCMHDGSSMAYQSVNGGLLDYIEMKDSGGTKATAKIIDGSTYLPFRYIAETAGLAEDNNISMGYYTFKYENTGTGKITVVTRKGRTTRDVGIPFDYTLDNGTVVSYEIININGSLYFPMRYMASLVGGVVDFQSSTGNIYFMSNEKIEREFLTGEENDKSIKYKKMASMNFKEYDNTLGYSDIYLTSDGTTVSSVTEEMRGSKTFYSVTRSRKNLYFVDENYKVWTKKEGDDAASELKFYNTKNLSVEPLVLTIVSCNNKLYGIEIENTNSGTGKIFESDMDGENYRYIGSCDSAYNLILRESDAYGFIFYVDGRDNKTLHRIDLSTSVDDTLYLSTEFTNGIDILTLDNEYIIYSELYDNKIDIIKLSDAESMYNSNRTFIEGYLYNEINDINKSTSIKKVSSMNFDDDNNLLYFINNTGTSYGMYCYDVITSKINGINTSKNVKRRISIIKMSENLYRIYHYSDATINEYKYELISISDDGQIKIGNDIKLER